MSSLSRPGQEVKHLIKYFIDHNQIIKVNHQYTVKPTEVGDYLFHGILLDAKGEEAGTVHMPLAVVSEVICLDRDNPLSEQREKLEHLFNMPTEEPNNGTSGDQTGQGPGSEHTVQGQGE